MLINKICELHILQFTIQILFWICVLVQKHKTYVSDSKTLLSFTSWQNGYCASREPTFRHDILCSLVGWAASSTEAASDPLALLGLIIAGPLGMLEQVSNWARLHHITPTPHCWQVPRGQVMSWHGCPVSELVPGLPLTCPPPIPPPPSPPWRRESRPSGWGTGGASWCQLQGEISKVADTCPNSRPPAPTMHLVRPCRPIVGKWGANLEEKCSQRRIKRGPNCWVLALPNDIRKCCRLL